jgi:hypothetical protein
VEGGLNITDPRRQPQRGQRRRYAILAIGKSRPSCRRGFAYPTRCGNRTPDRASIPASRRRDSAWSAASTTALRSATILRRAGFDPFMVSIEKRTAVAARSVWSVLWTGRRPLSGGAETLSSTQPQLWRALGTEGWAAWEVTGKRAQGRESAEHANATRRAAKVKPHMGLLWRCER